MGPVMMTEARDKFLRRLGFHPQKLTLEDGRTIVKLSFHREVPLLCDGTESTQELEEMVFQTHPFHLLNLSTNEFCCPPVFQLVITDMFRYKRVLIASDCGDPVFVNGSPECTELLGRMVINEIRNNYTQLCQWFSPRGCSFDLSNSRLLHRPRDLLAGRLVSQGKFVKTSQVYSRRSVLSKIVDYWQDYIDETQSKQTVAELTQQAQQYRVPLAFTKDNPMVRKLLELCGGTEGEVFEARAWANKRRRAEEEFEPTKLLREGYFEQVLADGGFEARHGLSKRNAGNG